jgi:hypothetical protein
LILRGGGFMDKPAPQLVRMMLQAHETFVGKVAADDRLLSLSYATPEELRCAIETIADAACDAACATATIAPSADERAWMSKCVIDEAFGLGPLEPLLRDREADAIVIRGPRDVWLERTGQLQETSAVFADDEHVCRTLERQPRLKPCVQQIAGETSPSWRIDLGQLRELVRQAPATAPPSSTPSSQPSTTTARPWWQRILG